MCDLRVYQFQDTGWCLKSQNSVSYYLLVLEKRMSEGTTGRDA